MADLGFKRKWPNCTICTLHRGTVLILPVKRFGLYPKGDGKELDFSPFTYTIKVRKHTLYSNLEDNIDEDSGTSPEE